MTICAKPNSIHIFTIIITEIPILFALFYIFSVNNSYAISDNTIPSQSAFSPSISVQELVDSQGDWSKINTDPDESTLFNEVNEDIIKNLTGSTIGDINSVNYVSDGRYLNVTFWLSQPFEEKPSKHIPSYNVLIDADSDPTTGGDLGIDYRIRVIWDNGTKTWNEIIEQVSKSETTKIIYQNNNFTNFFNKNDSFPPWRQINSWYPTHSCCYVNIPIDLHLLNFPKQYSAVFQIIDSFYITDNTLQKKPFFVVDATSRVGIPPPQFFISTENNSIEVKAGENEKKILLRLNSTSFLPSFVTLSVNKEDMVLELSPNKLYISPKSSVTSVLRINTFPYTMQGPHTLDITAKVYFPTVNEKNQYSFQNPKLGITTSFNMIVTVTAPPTFDERFSAFWDVYGNALNLIAGGFVGGLSGWFFARLEKRKDERK